MATDFPFDEQLRFTAADDELHAPGPHRDWTETVWFSFAVPARALAGWLYVQTRPNAGSSSGGAFVYGPAGFLAWELPYYGFLSHQPLPDPLDLRDVTFSNGVSVRVVEPTMGYDLGYRFRDHDEFVADLHFAGISPPVPHLAGAPPFTGSSHYDQHGRVTGELQLAGERIAVDCISVPRPVVGSPPGAARPAHAVQLLLRRGVTRRSLPRVLPSGDPPRRLGGALEWLPHP